MYVFFVLFKHCKYIHIFFLFKFILWCLCLKTLNRGDTYKYELVVIHARSQRVTKLNSIVHLSSIKLQASPHALQMN